MWTNSFHTMLTTGTSVQSAAVYGGCRWQSEVVHLVLFPWQPDTVHWPRCEETAPRSEVRMDSHYNKTGVRMDNHYNKTGVRMDSHYNKTGVRMDSHYNKTGVRMDSHYNKTEVRMDSHYKTEVRMDSHYKTSHSFLVEIFLPPVLKCPHHWIKRRLCITTS